MRTHLEERDMNQCLLHPEGEDNCLELQMNTSGRENNSLLMIFQMHPQQGMDRGKWKGNVEDGLNLLNGHILQDQRMG